MKNQKIHEMIQLLDIKTSKEKFRTELEGIRAEISKERSVLASLKQQSGGASPALDLVVARKKEGGEQPGGEISRELQSSRPSCPPETTIPSLTPAVSRTGGSKGREREGPGPPVLQPGRPDYYRHMFDPSAVKVPRLCEGKTRDFTRDGIFGGGLPGHNHHQSHLPHNPPPMLPTHSTTHQYTCVVTSESAPVLASTFDS